MCHVYYTCGLRFREGGLLFRDAGLIFACKRPYLDEIYIFGMYISNYNSFDVLGRRVNTNFKAVYFSALAVVITAYLRFALYGDQVTIDFLFAFSIIASSFLILSKIPVLNTVLEHLGKHSGMIFMFHTFIFSLYFEEFIYWFKYSPVIFIVMVVVGLEWLKKITRYNKLFLKL